MKAGQRKSAAKFSKPYLAWRQLRKRGALPLEWASYDDFLREIGDAPAKNARLSRRDLRDPHGSGNTYWAIPEIVPPVKQIRLMLKERYVAENKILLRIRKAKNRPAMIRSMTAARKAGYSYQIIGIAAGMSRQGVHQILGKRLRRQRQRTA
jgi:hypothetical protein